MHHHPDEEPPGHEPFRRPDSLPGQSTGFIDKETLPIERRHGSLSYEIYPGVRPELSMAPGLGYHHISSRRTDQSFSGRALSLRTMTNTTSMPEYNYLDRVITDSPAQRVRSTPNLGTVPHSPYPLIRTDGTPEEMSASPRPERLPSFHQLSKIADGGTDGPDARVVTFSTSYSGAMVAQHSMVHPQAHPHFSPSQQSSPTAKFAMLSHPSPTNTRNESHEVYPGPPSPTAYSNSSHFASRRRSPGTTRPPLFVTTTTSSSNETNTSHHSYQSSNPDGYSTNQSTPAESISSLDGTPKPPFPPPPRLQHSTSAPVGFSCEYPGCTAAPFQTQYLLNSHANVHSSNRPHYCPVKGCPRGEGGKGFKRKNEMIRHGLVHDSPGYICPFCPLREHKYPRPDNLQRHVRVHHTDKDKDDPLLREVLAQRPEGGRGRRRRTGP